MLPPPIYVCIIYKHWLHAGNVQEMSSWMYNGQVHCLEHPAILCTGNLPETIKLISYE